MVVKWEEGEFRTGGCEGGCVKIWLAGVEVAVKGLNYYCKGIRRRWVRLSLARAYRDIFC